MNQVYSAAGLASLLQLRVTELPSFISPEGLEYTDVFLGPSGETKKHVKTPHRFSVIIFIKDNENLKVEEFGLIVNVDTLKIIIFCVVFTHN